MNETEFAADPNYLTEKHKEGCLFVFEKYLGHLPWDWHDCVMFIATQGIDQRKDAGVVIMDDEETERVFKILSKDSIPLYVFSEKKKNEMTVIWNCLIEKEMVDGHSDPKALYIGGEHLRKFCDERNIFYRTAKSKDGNLLSGSNLLWLKEEGEDCRNPLNPHYQG